MSIYRGRFAPSPTGPLHQGSLFAALISYLEARSNNGSWLLRIEDVDAQREQAGARQAIINTLIAHGFLWDEPPSLQSEHAQNYEEVLKRLSNQGHTYLCPCSRKQLTSSNGQHLNSCHIHANVPSNSSQINNLHYAIKFKLSNSQFNWDDDILGPMQINHIEDFVLKRKEGFYAYQLAVVCDDLSQGITHVVRGSDLLDSTPMQLALYQALNKQPPAFGHLPILLNAEEQKLSKQTYAPAINNNTPVENLMSLFDLLKLPIKQKPSCASEALTLALEVWDRDYIPKIKSLNHHTTTKNN